ncbi:MAG: AAA family ATPase [Candidatus Eremiobacteraeota bacterium]|nr:AAA family ATPase [Candidatus Eremiobacteraeota bacterium]
MDHAKTAVTAFNAASAPESPDFSRFQLPADVKLIGIDPAVYRQIEAAVNADKRHVMLYGPPGTGKTELARYIASRLGANPYILVTGSSDWSSQDLIGGYQPLGGGEIGFVPGILLKNFDRPLIIDEMNRCDIDKVLGPLFTVLSKGSTTLPYRVDVADPDSAQYQILGMYQAAADDIIFSPGPEWRIIATINTVDKSSLYQMSYALSRRFAWVFVDAPTDLDAFVRAYVTTLDKAVTGGRKPCVLARVWDAVNTVRRMGAAPFIDVIAHCFALDDSFDFGSEPNDASAIAYTDAFRVHVMPMLDGTLKDEMSALADAVVAAFGTSESDAEALRRQMVSIGL